MRHVHIKKPLPPPPTTAPAPDPNPTFWTPTRIAVLSVCIIIVLIALGVGIYFGISGTSGSDGGGGGDIPGITRPHTRPFTGPIPPEQEVNCNSANGGCVVEHTEACSSTLTCVCKSGFQGNQCEQTKCNPLDCSNHGTCNFTTGICACASGWSGASCNTRNPDIPEGVYLWMTTMDLRVAGERGPLNLKAKCDAEGKDQVFTDKYKIVETRPILQFSSEPLFRDWIVLGDPYFYLPVRANGVKGSKPSAGNTNWGNSLQARITWHQLWASNFPQTDPGRPGFEYMVATLFGLGVEYAVSYVTGANSEGFRTGAANCNNFNGGYFDTVDFIKSDDRRLGSDANFNPPGTVGGYNPSDCFNITLNFMCAGKVATRV